MHSIPSFVAITVVSNVHAFFGGTNEDPMCLAKSLGMTAISEVSCVQTSGSSAARAAAKLTP